MFKNLSPNALTIYIALLVSLFNIGIQYIFSVVNGLEVNLGLLVLSALASFIICYLIVRFFVAQYLIRKIRLIYNIIQKSKFGKASDVQRSKSDLRGNVWETVESDVAKWATITETEIENLKELEEYRKDFLGNISHELKTPLFSIQGYVHTLLDGGIDDENVNVRFLRRAADNVDRLITIVEDLEIISNLEASINNLEIETFDIKKFTQEVVLDLSVHANKKGITIDFPYKGPAIMVKGDKGKYRQVFSNLISNSIKYGKTGGTTKLNIHDLHSYLLIEVEDNGIGIDTKHLNHLFARFYRVDKSRSRDVGGSGLGLSIVKHIVEAHGQTISVRSTLGQGSTFGFTIEKA